MPVKTRFPAPPTPLMPTYRNVAILGVGLIGGSIGLALRQRGLAGEVVGIGRRQASLDKALAHGAVDRATTDLAEGAAAAEVVVIATPVDSVVEDVCRAVAAAPSTAWVTDVGSAKAAICGQVETRLADAAKRFVGSHPLAGDHRCGPENASASLLTGKTVVVTPYETTPTALAKRAAEFWQALGASVTTMSPAQHDQALAATSHLPHLVASALAASTPVEWLPLAASGWADTTRLAAADPALWTQIFAQNQADVLESLDRFIEQLKQLQTALVDQRWSQIQDQLQQAKRMRDALGN